ncbi:tetratricopeptide repeat protein [Tunicatimonas pelagia]|uniref:tetratricopeptide repeat protein n=1 Tax=Tunicatimonas pelagia TaxID=931531 RepID=UPI0026651717|nr:tetratricopeptide repeat protein [Tunicatimonas pelagia]WKN43426.1 tetratricopeptide repeat protein [Tunicatimonas pelagia]
MSYYMILLFSWVFIGIMPLAVLGQEAPPDTLIESEVATLAERSRMAQARAYYRQAERYERNDAFAEAIVVLNQAIALKHDFKEALRLRARLHQRKASFTKALTDYQSLLFLDPALVEIRFEKAQLLYRLNRYEAAIADFKFLLEHDLGETTTVYFRGNTQANVDGNTSFSATSIGTIQSGMKADIWNFLGLSYLALEDYKKAVLYFELALSHQQEDATIYNNLGLASEHLGDTLVAIDYYRQALLIQPDHADALQNFSFLIRKSDNLDVAQTTFAQLNEEGSSATLLHQGMMLHQADQFQQAIAAYNKGLRQSPQDADLYLQRGFSYEKLHQFQRALTDYTQALTLNPTLEKGYLNRGNIYYKLKKFDTAERDYLTALQLTPDNSKTHYNLGLVYHRKKQIVEACQALERAVALGYKPAQEIINKICSSQ